MAFQELSFAPDRRSVQGLTFHFSDRPSGEPGSRGFSQQDSLAWTLDRIYQSKFPGITPSYRSTLVGILIKDIPLAHRNLTMLAAANLIVYDMRTRYQTNKITPELFSNYFNRLAGYIISDVTGKKAEEVQLILANFKITLLRYVFYILENTVWFTHPTT